MRMLNCRAWRIVSLAVFILSAGAIPALAQSESGGASIQGQVADPSEHFVPNANLTARETQTGYTRRAVSEADGSFRLSALPVGTYTLDVEATGFGASKIDGVELTVGDTRTVNIRLQVAAVSTQVSVTADVSVLNETDTATSLGITEKAIDELPIRGRNFTEFFQLTPGIVQEQDRYGMVVNGQRSINSNISLDGVDFNDSLQGGNRGGTDATYVFPQLAIREFQIVRESATAEIGRTSAGFMNIVTKSGTNDIHGEALYANRNATFTSPDAFNNPTSNNLQNQLGGSLGGAIKRDRLFYFGAVEKNWLSIPYTVKFTAPSGSIPIPTDIASQEGQFANVNDPLVAFGKVDYLLNEKNSLNVTYNYAGLSGLNFSGPTGQTTSAETTNSIVDRSEHGVKLGLTTVLSPNTLNEFRFQYAYDHRLQSSVAPGANIIINDLGALGGFVDGGYIYNADRWEWLDNYSWNRGIHSIRFGVDANINPEQQSREYNRPGVYTFNTLADYEAGKIAQFQQTLIMPGAPGIMKATQRDAATFIQDRMRLRPDFTLTVGLRWDGQFEPDPNRPNPAYPMTSHIPNDLHQWQPRLGLAWNIGNEGTTVLRAGAGIYDSRTPGYLLSRAFTDNGVDSVVLDSNVDPNILKYITFPNALMALPAGVHFINSMYAFDPNFKNPSSGQLTASLERQIDRATKVTIGYVYQETWHLQRRIDENLFPPTLDATGDPIYPKGPAATAGVLRPDPNMGQININQSTAIARYRGLQINVQRRLSHHLTYNFNYTYSSSKDDDSNERDFNRQTALDTYNFKLNWSYSKQDIRHNGNMQVLYDLPFGLTWSTLLLAHTGLPYTAVVGSDNQNDGNTTNDRTIINGRVSDRFGFRQPGFFDWDMRLLKTFKIGERARIMVSAEGFNLTRSTNKGLGNNGESKSGKPLANGAINPNTGQAFSNNSFTIPTASPSTDRFGGPRQVQLGARVVF